MILRQTCLRLQSIRNLQTSAKALAAGAAAPSPSRPTSVNGNIPKPNLPQNDPLYTHPPCSVKAGTQLKGCQIIKDKPEIVAAPDEHYPDWLWQLLDDPAPVEALKVFRKEEQRKRKAYVAQLEEEERKKKLEAIEFGRMSKPQGKRTEIEKWEARREAQNQAWLVNREKEYEYAQFEMPPERNKKFHRPARKEKIKQDNYLRAKGLK